MVKITAVKVSKFNDLIEKYENPIKHACGIREGDVFISKNAEIPEDIAPKAPINNEIPEALPSFFSSSFLTLFR